MNTVLAPGIFCGAHAYPHYVGQHGVVMLHQFVTDSFADRVERLKGIVKKHPDIELVGHSAGALVVLRVAHEVQVKGVTLVSPVHMPGCMLPLNVNLALMRYLRFKKCVITASHANKFFFTDKVSPDNFQNLVDESWRVIWALAWYQVARRKRHLFIPKSGTPIRVLCGDEDVATPFTSCAARTAKILGVQPEKLSGFGHMPFLQDKHLADKFNLRRRIKAHV
jgi:pimeloyl-ACP methyl ester carboxylesterase